MCVGIAPVGLGMAAWRGLDLMAMRFELVLNGVVAQCGSGATAVAAIGKPSRSSSAPAIRNRLTSAIRITGPSPFSFRKQEFTTALGQLEPMTLEILHPTSASQASATILLRSGSVFAASYPESQSSTATSGTSAAHRDGKSKSAFGGTTVMS